MGLFRRRRHDKATAADGDQLGEVDSPPVRLSPLGAPMWSGRDVYLPHPPTPEYAPQIAQEFADSIVAADLPTPGLRELDYSLESLRTVDEVLGAFENIGSDDIAEVVFLAGFYIGEVFVRAQGYRWVEVPPDVAPLFGFRHAVQGPRGNIANVLGRAFKRIENGDEDSVVFFAEGEIAGDARHD